MGELKKYVGIPQEFQVFKLTTVNYLFDNADSYAIILNSRKSTRSNVGIHFETFPPEIFSPRRRPGFVI